ncbi:IPT/TIG domain-containing protein [bacterium]|nr:IPT/TIG domain-containing protein [bacterium]
MSIKISYTLKIAAMMFIILLAACEYDGPQAVWQPDEAGASNPVITTVTPSDWAFAGITEITIQGQNFPDQMDFLKVYIGGKQAEIISLSQTEIHIRPPYHESVLKSNMQISVVSQNAFLAALYSPYQLKEASREYGNFQSQLDQIFSIAADPQENVYAMLKGKTIAKITPDGEREDSWATTPFPKASDMRASADFLYLQRSNNASLYRIPLNSGGTASVFVTLPERMRFIELAANDIIYAGGTENDIYIIQSDGSFTASTQYADFDIKGMRIFNGMLYVAANYNGSNDSFPASGIFHSTISSSDGSLGTPEIYFDISQSQTHASSDFHAITFAEDGDLYIGTDNNDPILIVHPNGSEEILYPGILSPEIEHLAWGNADFLYTNRTGDTETRNLVRVDMGKPGAH